MPHQDPNLSDPNPHSLTVDSTQQPFTSEMEVRYDKPLLASVQTGSTGSDRVCVYTAVS